MEDTLPGPCYPNWPNMNGAFARHRLDVATLTCRYCKLPWEDSVKYNPDDPLLNPKALELLQSDDEASEDYDEWDVLVDTDPLELRDRARALAAENERLRVEYDTLALIYIEATNPGIDMAEVRRIRAELRDQHLKS